MRFYQTTFLTGVLCLNLLAQTEPIKTKTDEVIVTATRSLTSTKEVASSFTIITSEQMSKYQKANVLDYLRDAEGIEITQQGGKGSIASAFLRGASPAHLLVLIDGIKMNNPSSPDNAYDLSTLLVDYVDRIEIVRGPQSTLYGSEAVAGVINVITKHGNTDSKISFLAEGGSNNFYRGNINATGSIGKLNYSANFSEYQTDGFSAISSEYGNKEKDKSKLTNALVNFGYKLSEDFSIDAGYIFTKSKFDLDQSDKFGDDPNYTYDYEEHVVRSELTGKFLDDALNSKIYFSSSRRFANAIDKEDPAHIGISSTNNTWGKRTTFSWQNNFQFSNNEITFGIESENESAESAYKSNSPWGPYESIFPKKDLTNSAVYLQDQLKFNGSLFAALGVRYDKHEKFGNAFTYRIAPAFLIASTQTKIKASFGTGFKAPSLFYLFDPMFGNSKLNPEKSIGFDLGFEQYLIDSKFSFGATYFSTSFKDMIGFDENFKTVNIKKAETSGVEFYSELHLSSFNARLTYTNLSALDKSPNISKADEKLIRRPKNKASLNISYSPYEVVSINTLFRFVGQREDVDFSSFPSKRVTLPSYLLVDFSLGYKILDQIKLNMRVENIFDKKYEEVLFYGTSRRALYFSVGYNLNI